MYKLEVEIGIVFVNEQNFLRTNEIFCERWCRSEKNERWTNDLDRSEK